MRIGSISGSANSSLTAGVIYSISGSFTALTGTNILSVSGISGSLTKLSDGSDYLVGIGGISLITQSNGSIIISSSAGVGATTPGGSNGEIQFNKLGVFSGSSNLTIDQTGTTTATILSSNSGSFNFLTGTIVLAKTGFSGSLTKLSNGSSYIVAGSGIDITTQSNGSILITGSIPGGSSGQIQFNKNGAFTGSSALSIDQTGTTTVSIISSPSGSFTYLTGSIILAKNGITGSLTKLTDGTDYLIAGSNITLTTGSKGQITIASSGGSSLSADSDQVILATQIFG